MSETGIFPLIDWFCLVFQHFLKNYLLLRLQTNEIILSNKNYCLLASAIQDAIIKRVMGSADSAETFRTKMAAKSSPLVSLFDFCQTAIC